MGARLSGMLVRIAVALLLTTAPALADYAALLSPGAVGPMRHATASGTDDPRDFRLGDCATQRNLSDEGRAEARAIGRALHGAGVAFTHILASEWCRTAETAKLLELGEVQPFPPANAFFGNRADGPRQTQETLEALARLPEGSLVMIVRHQVNITALTSVVPRSGEIVVAEPDGQGGLRVMARIPPP